MLNQCVLCDAVIVPQLTLRQLLGLDLVQANFLCGLCRAEFEFIKVQYCKGCGRNYCESLCIDCQFWQRSGYTNFQHRALCSYNQAMHDYFKLYKRYGDYRLRQAFSADLKACLADYCDPFIYVPSASDHFQIRQFDPVAGLFGDLVALQPALIKLPTNMSQAQKNRRERLNTPQFFQFNLQYQSLLTVSQITLIDDIYTTGRTIFHARDCLRQAGFKGTIRSFSLAR